VTDVYSVDDISFAMVRIPGRNYEVCTTETTQELYEKIMGDNPSYYSGEMFPCDSMSWYDCIVFCNKLSLSTGKNPYYSVNGETDPDKWDYEPHGATSIKDEVKTVDGADGFRLLTEEEWEFAARGGENFIYAGSDDSSVVGWNRKNSGYAIHKVASKKSNGYGLYDMCGNVWEWVFDVYPGNSHFRIYKGGSWASENKLCEIDFTGKHYPSRTGPCYSYYDFGFRFACNY